MKTVFSELWVSWTWNTHGTNDETELYIYMDQMRIGTKTHNKTKIPFYKPIMHQSLAAVQKSTRVNINPKIQNLGLKIRKLGPTIRNLVPIRNLILIQYLWEDHTRFISGTFSMRVQSSELQTWRMQQTFSIFLNHNLLFYEGMFLDRSLFNIK